MELHTLGVNGGYTQADVTQVARVLTGWTIDRPLIGGELHLQPQPPRARHEKSPWQKDQRRRREGRPRAAAHARHQPRHRPLHLRASWPSALSATIRRQALVDRMAKSYLSSGGDIPTVLKTLFHSPEFWSTSDIPRQGQDAARIRRLRRARRNADIENLRPLATTSARWACRSTARSAHRLRLESLHLGQHRRARRPHELCPRPRRQPPPRHHRRLDAAIAEPWPAPRTPHANARIRRSPPRADASFPAASAPQPAPPPCSSSQRRSRKPPATTSQACSPWRIRAFNASAQRQLGRRASAQFRCTSDEDQLLAGLLIGSPEFQRR